MEPQDVEVSAAFQRLVQMPVPPQSLFAPRLPWKVLVKNHPAPRAEGLPPQTAG